MQTENTAVATQPQKQLTTKSLFSQENIRKKFEELLDKRASAFMTSVLQCVASNALLSKADPMTVLHAAMVAATLNLPLNNNLGFAYIVPYNNTKAGKVEAQLNIGYKGFIQLAQRSGQFKSVYAAPIYEGQIVKEDPLSGFEFDFTIKSDSLIGYASRFTLVNGFEATLYMSVADLQKHAKRYSQSFKYGTGLWKDNFEAMASKTVIKLLLSKFAPLSIDMQMQTAITTDQGIIKSDDMTEVEYIDNETPEINKEHERIELLIAQSITEAELMPYKEQCVTPELMDKFQEKEYELAAAKEADKEKRGGKK